MNNKITIKFKSIPEMFHKEIRGIKNNTFRKVNMSEEKFQYLEKFSKDIMQEDLEIEIKCTKDNFGKFTRQVKDVTFWDDYCIITWRA